MKCVRLKDGKTIQRLDDAKAHQLVNNEKATYVVKKFWKAEVRDQIKGSN